MNNKEMYEQIMRGISKEVKNILNESANQEEPIYAFLMVRFKMPSFISEIMDNIDGNDLYSDPEDQLNRYGLERESHVTLFPCLDKEVSLNDICSYLPNVRTLRASLKNISLFEQEKYNVLKADVDEDSNLFELNNKLSKHFVCHSEYSYHPHMTIAYIKKDAKANNMVRELNTKVELTPMFYDYSIEKDGKYNHIIFNVK